MILHSTLTEWAVKNLPPDVRRKLVELTRKGVAPEGVEYEKMNQAEIALGQRPTHHAV